MPSVAIIGAGPSGLAAAKSALERGLQPVVFEASSQVGGMWAGPGRGAWSASARTNLSYYSCAFSDFPWPSGTDIFPLRSAVADYLAGYAAAFDLAPHIRFNTRVDAIHRDGQSGRRRTLWRVDHRDASGQPASQTFDHVIIATGFFSRPSIPSFPGLTDYRGQVHHSADCDCPQVFGERFAGKRVLVVGAAFSGTEIACLAAQFAKSVTVALRSPMWFVPRWVHAVPGEARYPIDLVFYNRDRNNPLIRERNRFLTSVAGNPGLSAPDLAFDKNADPPAALVITDEFLGQVRTGMVGVKRSATLSFDATGVIFADGSRRDIDVVVMCTGFASTLPFLDANQLLSVGFSPDDQLQPTLLHRHLFHPDLPGLAFIGHYRGPYFPVMELQSRWVAGIISGDYPLPTTEAMMDGIAAERQMRLKLPRPQFPHGDFVGLADGLAREVGVFPALPVRHPLHEHIALGPVVPPHYRLVGPHAAPDLAQRRILETPAPLLEKTVYHADID